jgi:hypothetical protein
MHPGLVDPLRWEACANAPWDCWHFPHLHEVLVLPKTNLGRLIHLDLRFLGKKVNIWICGRNKKTTIWLSSFRHFLPIPQGARWHLFLVVDLLNIVSNGNLHIAWHNSNLMANASTNDHYFFMATQNHSIWWWGLRF